jgi:hypothetical protein
MLTPAQTALTCPYRIVPTADGTAFLIESAAELYDFVYPDRAAARAAIRDFLRQDVEADELALEQADTDGMSEVIDLRVEIGEILDATRDVAAGTADLAELRRMLEGLQSI